MLRDIHLDNAKGLLILSVVFGHLLWPLPADRVNQTAYSFVYLIHMPLFAFISGYLSRDVLDSAVLRRLVSRLLVPYAVFELIQYALLAYYGRPSAPLSGLYGLWYLLSLFWWRLMLPAVTRLHPFWGMTVALAAALAAGLVDAVELPLSASRTLAFFPYVLAGFLLGRGRTTREETASASLAVLRPFSRPIACAVLLCALGAASLFLSEGRAYFLLFDAYPYAALELTPLTGVVLRALHILLTFLTGAAVLSLVPGKEGGLTRLGRNSLTVYLLHSPLLVVYREHPALYESVCAVPVAGAAFVALGVTAVLASPPVVRVVRRLVQPLG